MLNAGPVTKRYKTARGCKTRAKKQAQLGSVRTPPRTSPTPEETAMRKLLVTTAIIGIIVAGMAGDASAWSRKGTVTTNRGTFTSQGSGSCANGACSRSGSTTGPNGRTVTSQSSGSCANGSCSSSGTITGPNGKTVDTSGSVTKTGQGTYDYSHSATGPNGGSVTKSGTVTVTPPTQ